MTKKEVKKLSKNLVLAIDWAAAEYKYLEKLQEELQEIEKSDQPLKRLRKASKILHYVSRAERRADKFEERARKGIEKVYEELEEHLGEQLDLKDLISGIREIAKELEVERAHLVKYASFYEGTLEKELGKAAAETKLEEKIKADNPWKAQQTHAVFLQLLYQIEYQVKDAEKWVAALEQSLRKAKQILEKLPEEDKSHLIQEGLDILHEYRWPYPDDEKTTIFLAQHPADLQEMAVAAGGNAWSLFQVGLPAVKDLINEKTWPMVVDGLVKMTVAAGVDAWSLFYYGLPAVKDLINEKTWPGMVQMAVAAGVGAGNLFQVGLPAVKDLINEKTWSGMVQMAVAAGVGAWGLFYYSLPADKDLINEQTWPEIVQLVLENKDKLNHVLYSGQRITFFKGFNGKLGIKRGKLRKTGSETIVLGGPLVGKAIIRIITDQAFQAWKKAFEAEDFWKGQGFDYVPVEPILRKNGKLRAYKTREGLWRVSTQVLGPSLNTFLSKKENQADKIELLTARDRIIAGLGALKVGHGHLHEGNFCIEFHDRKLRLYVIDFDMAVS